MRFFSLSSPASCGWPFTSLRDTVYLGQLTGYVQTSCLVSSTPFPSFVPFDLILTLLVSDLHYPRTSADGFVTYWRVEADHTPSKRLRILLLNPKKEMSSENQGLQRRTYAGDIKNSDYIGFMVEGDCPSK